MNKKSEIIKRHEDFDSEVTPHLYSLRKYALRITNDVNDSEDLLQDTLLRAFRFFCNFEKGTNAKAWLFKIMKNSFINDYRKKIKLPVKVDYAEIQNISENRKAGDVIPQHSHWDSFKSVFDDTIINALAILPDEFRTIVILCDIKGYTYKEISDFIHCPLGTVRSRLHRSRKVLYNRLYNYARENGYVKSRMR